MRLNPSLAIINFGMGNLFSVEQAARKAGFHAEITHDKEKIKTADAIILPGVGAFGGAMEILRRLDLISAIKSFVESKKPVMCICLGMQLLMTKSYEFGEHEGLDLIKGEVVNFGKPVAGSGKSLKVPHVGWNTLKIQNSGQYPASGVIEGISDGDYMYFVHSFYVKPDDSSIAISTSRYGDVSFCSSLGYENIFACQFHPERSGEKGLKIYENFRRIL